MCDTILSNDIFNSSLLIYIFVFRIFICSIYSNLIFFQFYLFSFKREKIIFQRKDGKN